MKNEYPLTSANGRNEGFLYPIFENLSAGLELYDHNGRLTEINPAELESMGVQDKNDILGHYLFDNPGITEEIKTQIEKGETVRYIAEYDFDSARFPFPTHLSGIKYFEVTVSFVHNDAKEITNYLVMTREVTERVLWQQKYENLYAELSKRNAEIEKKEELLEKILDSMPLSIHIKDVEDGYRYVFCNEESKRLFGTAERMTAYDIMDKQLADKLHESDREVYESGTPYTGNERIVLKDGREYETIVQKKLLEDERKRLLLNIRWDRTLQSELERRSKVLSISLDGLHAYTWYYNIENDLLTYGDGFEKIGRNPEAVDTMGKFISGLHPEDQKRVASLIGDVIKNGEGSFSAEYRIDLKKDGVYTWREFRGAIETVVEGDVSQRYLFGIDINIEDHKKTELALLESKEEMMQLIRQNEMVLNNNNSGLAYITNDYIVQWENISLCSKSLSYEAYKKGEACYKTAHNRTTPCENCVMQRARKSGQVETIQFSLNHSNVIEVIATPVYNDQAEVEGVVIRVDDVTERQHMIGELEKARRQAEQSDKLKSAFLANMSHEIRTPLNSIVGFSDLLMVTEDPEEREEYSKIINTNNELLLKLINDILDLSKIEAGSVELKYEEFDLAIYFNELATAMQRHLSNPKVRLTSVNPYPTCVVKLDRNRFAQILTNFVTNAIKYTPEGTIEMGYEVVKEGIRIDVRDTGIGIPEDKKQKVFHRFEKLDEFAQGTGLGLSICKAIIEACGGSIGFDSVYGEGSRFWAVFPCSIDLGGDQASASLPTEEDSRGEEYADVSEERKEVQKTILVAEDIQSNFFLVSSILKNKCKLLHASNGLKAVEIVQTQPVDLILMDMKMPVMDGRTATAEIRKFNTNVPIVALTAHAFDTDRLAALESGCDDYLVKPINGAKLMQALKEYGC